MVNHTNGFGNRPADSIAEKAQAEFLDAYFYPFLGQYGYEWHRENRREQQLRGIDGTLKFDNTIHYVDEKGAFHYINAELETFAFELLSIQRNRDIGWLIDDSHITDYYFITWPNAKCEYRIGRRREKHCAKDKNLRLLQKDNFSVIEGMLIQRGKIMRALENEGWDKNRLTNKAYSIRESNEYGLVSAGSPHFRFFHSRGPNSKASSHSGKTYVEEPINLLIDKTSLAKVADGFYLISKDGVGVIKDKHIINASHGA